MGLPRKGCSPLSIPPMRLPCPPASTTPVTSGWVELMQRRPVGPLLGERVDRGRAVDGRHEERERQVHLVGPVAVGRLEGDARAAMPAELAAHAGGGFVVAHQLLALREAHLRALEPDPGDHPRGMRRAAAPAIAVRAEARWEGRGELHAAAMATRDAGLRHWPASRSSPTGARR